jgi:acetyl esterase/lipase
VTSRSAVPRLLDPVVAAAVAQFPLDMAAISVASLPAMRQAAPPATQPADGVERADHMVVVGAGAPDVAVTVHRPVGPRRSLPTLVWLHGGGFVMGTAAMDGPRLDQWSHDLGCVCVNVDYRLAPEAPFPAALQDGTAALQWVHDNAAELGVERGRIGIGGISAGGGLAAGVALSARSRNLSVAFQCLIYPMLDDRMAHPSNEWDAPVWPPAANRFAWDAYLGGRAGADIPAEAAPGRATDLAGLPPAFVGVGALDGFLDEDVDYAMRLAHAGVPVELHVYPGACHGLDSMAPHSAPGQQLRRDVHAWLARALAGDFRSSSGSGTDAQGGLDA